MHHLREEFGDEVAFALVYVRESNAGRPPLFKSIAEPQTFEERRTLAARLSKEFYPGFPLVIDTLDDLAFHAYGEPRNATFIVDRENRIVFKGAWAPPSAVAAALRMALGRSGPTAIARGHRNPTAWEPTLEITSIPVEGMVCAGCEIAVGNAVRRVPGVRDVEVSFERAAVRVTFDPSLTSRSEIDAAIRETGFGLPASVE